MKIFLTLMILSLLVSCTPLEPTDHFKDPEFIHNERDSGYSKWE